MEKYTFNDVLANTKVTCEFPGLNTIVEELDAQDCVSGSFGSCSIFFPGCSFINYALPLVSAVYDTLKQAGEVDGITLLCCGKILSYETNGEQVRASFEEQLIDRLAQVGCTRLVCACPNCVGALRTAFERDPRMAGVKIEALPQVMQRMGYTVNAQTAQQIFARNRAEEMWYAGEFMGEPDPTAAFNAELARAPQAKFAVHDSCPDRETGEFADGLRAVIPADLWVDPAHCRAKSICCGSLPRAAGKVEAANKCALTNATEALEAGANAIVTPCVSCCFQLHMAQKLAQQDKKKQARLLTENIKSKVASQKLAQNASQAGAKTDVRKLAQGTAQTEANPVMQNATHADTTLCAQNSEQENTRPVPVFHYLELMYNWTINWREMDGLMKLRFLFDDILGAQDLRENRKRTFQGIGK